MSGLCSSIYMFSKVVENTVTLAIPNILNAMYIKGCAFSLDTL